MTTLRQAAQQALEALEWHYRQGHSNTLGGFRLKIDEKTIRTLRAALAQEKQETVTWGVDWGRHGDVSCCTIIKCRVDGVREVVAIEYAPPHAKGRA